MDVAGVFHGRYFSCNERGQAFMGGNFFCQGVLFPVRSKVYEAQRAASKGLLTDARGCCYG